MRRAPRYVVGAVLLALGLPALAACNDEPEPKFGPSESASPSASASESVDPEPEPLTKKETVRAWVDARNAALLDGDTSEMEQFHARECPGCDNFVRGVEEVFEAGGFYEGGGWAIRKTQVVTADLFDVRVQIAGGSTVNAAGEEPVVYSKSIRDLRFTMTPRGESWRIENIVLLQRP